MRGGIAREFLGERIETLAGGRLNKVRGVPARDKRGTAALANDPLDPRDGLAELSLEDADVLRDEAQETRGLGHAGDDQSTAFAFGNELASPLPAPHRAVLIAPDLEKAMVLLPFAKILLPARRERSKLAANEAAHAAVAIHPFLEPVGRKTVEFPKASAVGDERPNRRRGPGEAHFPMETVGSAAVCSHAALLIALLERRRSSGRRTG